MPAPKRAGPRLNYLQSNKPLMALNPFSPYAQTFNLELAESAPVPHEGALYHEIVGSDLWLVASGDLYWVSDVHGKALSASYWNAGYAVERAGCLRRPELAEKVAA